MDIIHTNSSFCGSGKTFDATTAACHGITQNKKTCIAVPSRRLAKQVMRDAYHRFPELKSRIASLLSGSQSPDSQKS